MAINREVARCGGSCKRHVGRHTQRQFGDSRNARLQGRRERYGQFDVGIHRNGFQRQYLCWLVTRKVEMVDGCLLTNVIGLAHTCFLAHGIDACNQILGNDESFRGSALLGDLDNVNHWPGRGNITTILLKHVISILLDFDNIRLIEFQDIRQLYLVCRTCGQTKSIATNTNG